MGKPYNFKEMISAHFTAFAITAEAAATTTTTTAAPPMRKGTSQTTSSTEEVSLSAMAENTPTKNWRGNKQTKKESQR